MSDTTERARQLVKSINVMGEQAWAGSYKTKELVDTILALAAELAAAENGLTCGDVIKSLREQLAAAESTARIEAQLADEEHERAEVAVGRLEKAQAALRKISGMGRVKTGTGLGAAGDPRLELFSEVAEEALEEIGS